jgi:LIVCS family branched-chain amino acid:cation transporter
MRQTNKDVLVVGVALFAMFFGAGNLIFPPYMGLLAGTDWKWALLGFLITGIGLPLLGIVAAARAGGTVDDMGRRVGPWFGRLLGIVIILAIGPLLAIPRTCATAFELGIRPSMPGFSTVLFSVIFFFRHTLVRPEPVGRVRQNRQVSHSFSDPHPGLDYPARCILSAGHHR